MLTDRCGLLALFHARVSVLIALGGSRRSEVPKKSLRTLTVVKGHRIWED